LNRSLSRPSKAEFPEYGDARVIVQMISDGFWPLISTLKQKVKDGLMEPGREENAREQAVKESRESEQPVGDRRPTMH
jgi:hypothetical protein